MENIINQTQAEFPEIEFCSVITPSDEVRMTELLNADAVKSCLPVLIWVGLADKATIPKLLRVKLVGEGELFVKRLNEFNFLMIVNKKENATFLLNYLKGMKHNLELAPMKVERKEKIEVSQKEIESEQKTHKYQDAQRIQKLIIPAENEIKAHFKNFFAIHQQQDVVGGDFYWYKKIGNNVLVSLVDCTGHSIEGAMTSMVCSSLLNQAMESLDQTNLSSFLFKFYDLLDEYNKYSDEGMDYGIGAEVGVFLFNYDSNEIRYVSSGVSAFLKRDNELDLLRERKIMNYSQLRDKVKDKVISMDGVTGLYTFTDGLTDQYDSDDKKKLGYKGVKKMIEQEENFDKTYYAAQLNSWMGENMQYDDITLLGLAI